MIRDFLFLGRVKRRLIEGSIPSAQVFSYFFIITAVDNLQLAILQVSPAEPAPLTPVAVWGSVAIGGVYLVATYFLNGGASGRDYLARYFSVSAVTALWVAVPFQSLLWLPRVFEPIARLDWYVPALLLIANIGIFSFIALQIRGIARGSRRAGANDS